MVQQQWIGWNKSKKEVLQLPEQQQLVFGKVWINPLMSTELIELIRLAM